jgi:hypothetical protein
MCGVFLLMAGMALAGEMAAIAGRFAADSLKCSRLATKGEPFREFQKSWRIFR